MLTWLDRETPFPPLSRALLRPNGLLAAGGDLSPARLLSAYRRGIFPWYSDGEPILWWSPDPRMVLFPAELKVSRSLGKALRNRSYEVRLDTAFDAVVAACAETRSDDASRSVACSSASRCSRARTTPRRSPSSTSCATSSRKATH